MVTISLCMIVKNEEETISRCLESVKDAVDEIIIVDTGSTDKTKDEAKRFTDKIFDFKWIDDFSAARNYSYEQASMDYIMWLDADDIIKPEELEKLKQLKERLTPEIDSVMLKYNTGFDANGNAVFSFYRERISKRSKGFKWYEPVHEYLRIGGNIINEDISVTHAKINEQTSDRNLKIYEKIINSGENLSPRGMFYYARELKDHSKHTDAVTWYKKFLDSKRGWIEDNITACGDMAKCLMAEGRKEEAFACLTHSFIYDKPRAEICCQIGYYFKDIESFSKAAFWFELALTLEKHDNNWGFRQNDCYGYIPSIELAVCYYRLRDYEKAVLFNEKAAEYKPDSPSVKYNRDYFMSIM